MTHVNMIEDSSGDLVEMDWYCSGFCFEQHTGMHSTGFAWPGGSETDYSVYCANCNRLMWEGLEEA